MPTGAILYWCCSLRPGEDASDAVEAHERIAGAVLLASCAVGSSDGGEAGAEAVGEVTGDGEMQNRTGRLRFAPRRLDK